MDKPNVEIVFILDMSSSMSKLRDEVVNGFNSFLEGQKKETPTALITTVFFNEKATVIHKRAKIIDVPPISQEQYSPSGATALLDAIGEGIEIVVKAQDWGGRPSQTIAIIITDGTENSSRKYTYKSLNEIVRKRQKHGWRFLYLAANAESLMEAARIGIPLDNAVEYESDLDGAKLNFRAIMSLAGFFIRHGSI